MHRGVAERKGAGAATRTGRRSAEALALLPEAARAAAPAHAGVFLSVYFLMTGLHGILLATAAALLALTVATVITSGIDLGA